MPRVLCALAVLGAVPAQERNWPAEVEEIHYEAADRTRRPALFYRPRGIAKSPLLVGLHTWSSDYKQRESIPYAKWCIDHRWVFVHPDFRGANRRPAATGSELAVSDIVRAVRYAKDKANVDEDRIYLVGVSGGGHAALLLAGRHPEIWAGVSAWVPITDLAAWHAECKSANRHYWKEIEASCGGAPGGGDAVDREYRARSPLTYLARAAGVNVDIHAGLDDGHTGSVPISHTLRAFNVLAAARDRFTAEQIAFMVEKRSRPASLSEPKGDLTYGPDNQPIVRRCSRSARVTIFRGGHEILPAAALRWLARQRRTWRMHVIDPATEKRQGADGVRLGDANGDGLADVVTGWEEGEAIRVYLNPGVGQCRRAWPAVTVGRVKSAEDAVFADLDGDGNLDVVSSTEGRIRTVYVHWAPKDPSRYMDETRWTTEPIPVTARKQQWMFALPMDVDGVNGVDLVVGSKGPGASVSWLRSPSSPRNLHAWTLHEIVGAGWIMSLRSTGDGTKLAPIVVSDRKGERRGVFAIVPNRSRSMPTWSRRELGGRGSEVMFLDLWPESKRAIVATRNGVILDFGASETRRVPNPLGIRLGKSVRVSDLDLDGDMDIAHAANTGRQKDKPGVAWMERTDAGWLEHRISDRGTKFDRMELLDLDGDGDLDLITCEENAGQDSRGLGVVWFENPTR